MVSFAFAVVLDIAVIALYPLELDESLIEQEELNVSVYAILIHVLFCMIERNIMRKRVVEPMDVVMEKRKYCIVWRRIGRDID